MIIDEILLTRITGNKSRDLFLMRFLKFVIDVMLLSSLEYLSECLPYCITLYRIVSYCITYLPLNIFLCLANLIEASVIWVPFRPY